jgi:hypothetical protein
MIPLLHMLVVTFLLFEDCRTNWRRLTTGRARGLEEALVLSESRNGVCAVIFFIWPPVGFAQDNIGLTGDRKGHM